MRKQILFCILLFLAAECVIYVPDDQIDAYKAAFAAREDVLARIQPHGLLRHDDAAFRPRRVKNE